MQSARDKKRVAKKDARKLRTGRRCLTIMDIVRRTDRSQCQKIVDLIDEQAKATREFCDGLIAILDRS